MINIDVANFSKTPFGRYSTDSDFSAEQFRETVLVPALESAEGDSIVVDFSRVALGVGSSFLEEAFGGLVRRGFDKGLLLDNINVVDRIGIYDKLVKKFITQAKLQPITK